MPTSRTVLEPGVILRGATHHFLCHATLDMDLLARELSISRATLYRAVGSRDRLLGDVFGLAGQWLFRTARARVAVVDGPDGVLAVTRAYVELIGSAGSLRRFIADEPGLASRVLFTTAGDVLRRSADQQAGIFREAGIDGGDLAGRAFLYVRIVESVLFAELLGTGPLTLAGAEPALRALLVRA